MCRDSGNRRRQKDYVPTMWDEHFEEKQDINLGEGQYFRVYFSKRDRENQKPLLVLLHGGGYSALTWALFTVNYFSILQPSVPTKCKFSQYIDRNNGDIGVPMSGNRFKRSR